MTNRELTAPARTTHGRSLLERLQRPALGVAMASKRP